MLEICSWLASLVLSKDLLMKVKSTPWELFEAQTFKVDKFAPHIALSISALLCVKELLLRDIPSDIGVDLTSQRYCLATASEEFSEKYKGLNNQGLLWNWLSLFCDKFTLLAEFKIELSKLEIKPDSNDVIEKVKLSVS